MSEATTVSVPRPSRAGRLLFALPLIGAFARDIERDVENVFWLLPILVLTMAVAVQIWGWAALVLTALAAVPLMFAFFVAISWP